MKSMDNPLVSISCITYNHASYIRKCLEGFMMQRTDFAFEVLIHDDASTDGTAEIIKEYQDKYPDIIKPIYEKENQWIKGKRGSAVFNFHRAKGKYIAMCEGDDYWTDPLKLQRQIDFMEANDDYVMCSHSYHVEDDKNKSVVIKSSFDRDYNLDNLVVGDWYFQPLSWVFRKSTYYLHLTDYTYSSDVILLYTLLRGGKGRYMSRVMGTYRHHNLGVWSKVSMATQRESEFVRRLAIAKVEKSRHAVVFLLSVFRKPVSRIWMLKKNKLMYEVFKMVWDILGFSYAIKFMIKKILGNNLMSRSELQELLYE